MTLSAYYTLLFWYGLTTTHLTHPTEDPFSIMSVYRRDDDVCLRGVDLCHTM